MCLAAMNSRLSLRRWSVSPQVIANAASRSSPCSSILTRRLALPALYKEKF